MKRTSLERVQAEHACSESADSYRAMHSVLEAIEADESSLSVVFASSRHDPRELERALREVGPGPTLCCTTAGEIGVGRGHLASGVVGASLRGVHAETYAIEDLAGFDAARADALRERMEPFLAGVKPSESVAAVVVLDGLSRREEWVARELYRVLGGVPLVGGSAGDDLAFRETFVLAGGALRSGVGCVALIATEAPTMTFMRHHFEPSGELVVVTEADPAARRVLELDGLTAGRTYRRATGLPEGPLPTEALATSPLMLGVGTRHYVRSIAGETPEGHLELFSSVERGMVLELGRPTDLKEGVRELVVDVERVVGRPELVIGFEGVQRRHELEALDEVGAVRDLLYDTPLIGFGTYGEVFGGLHVNQTLTGIAFGQ